MKLPSDVMGNHPVEAWECDDVSRNASEPDSASLKPNSWKWPTFPNGRSLLPTAKQRASAAAGLPGVAEDGGCRQIDRGTLEPGPGFGVGRGFAIRGPFPVQAPDKAPETCTWSTRSADRGSQVSALGVGLPSGTPFRYRHRIKHRKRAPGQRGLRVGANLQSRNLDGNQIAWKYRRCAGHANLLFRDGVKRQVGKCDCLLEFTTRPELSQSRARIWPQQHVPKRLKNSATRNSTARSQNRRLAICMA